MFERLLVPLDGSQLAEQALPYVVEIANGFASEIILITVCQSQEVDFTPTSKAYLEMRAEQLKGKLIGEVRIKKVVMVGRPAQEIAAFALRNNVGLIIMTSRGRSGAASWLLGSTANEIIHSVKIPVLVIKASGSSSATVKLRRLLVPLDGSERGEKILPYVEEMGERLSLEIVLLRVVAPGTHVRTVGGLDFVYFKDKDMESMKINARDYLKRLVAKLKHRVRTVIPEVEVGEPHQEIIKYAEKHDCDLIAMSSHGHSCVERWTYGSVTYKIMHQSTKPVLLVPLKADTVESNDVV